MVAVVKKISLGKLKQKALIRVVQVDYLMFSEKNDWWQRMIN
jgi:hypothetical protein